MTLFALFNIFLFVIGIVLSNSRPQKRRWVLVLACLFMSFAYYYLDKI